MNNQVNINNTYPIIEISRVKPIDKQWYIDKIADSLCSPRIAVVDLTIGQPMPDKNLEIDVLIIVK